MAIDISDEIFGVLTQWQNCDWEFKYFSLALDQDLTITIDGSEANQNDKPSNKVYEIYRWFNENQLNIKNSIENKIFETYQNCYEDFRDGWGDEAEEKVPKIRNKSDIWSLLKSPSVCFSDDFPDISISWKTTWDPEHGITLLFENGQITNVE